MYEIGSGIIPDAPTMEAESGVANFGYGYARHSNINCHPLHVQAAPGDTVPVGPEVLVRAWGAIAAHHDNLSVRTPIRDQEIMQEIEQMRIIFVHLACAIVTQVFVDANQGRGIIAIAMAVHNVKAFSRMNVEEMQAIGNFRRSQAGGDPRTKRNKYKYHESEPMKPNGMMQ
jgi:hypothetical protein